MCDEIIISFIHTVVFYNLRVVKTNKSGKYEHLYRNADKYFILIYYIVNVNNVLLVLFNLVKKNLKCRDGKSKNIPHKH